MAVLESMNEPWESRSYNVLLPRGWLRMEMLAVLSIVNSCYVPPIELLLERHCLVQGFRNTD